jgi:hypothetical protein
MTATYSLPLKDEAAAGQMPSAEQPGASGEHPVYYESVTYVDDANTPRLDYHRGPGWPIPEPFRKRREEFEEVEGLLRVLFEDDRPKLVQFLTELSQVATCDLCGEYCDPQSGNLKILKEHVTYAYPGIREKLWKWNSGLLVGALALCGGASIIFHEATQHWYPAIDAASIWPPAQVSVFLIPLGAILGLFIEFVFRVSDDIQYVQLKAINPGRWKPVQRAFNTVVVAYTLATFMALGVLNIGLGGIELNEFIIGKDGKPPHPQISLLIGFVTGFAFPYVRDLLHNLRPTDKHADTHSSQSGGKITGSQESGGTTNAERVSGATQKTA